MNVHVIKIIYLCIFYYIFIVRKYDNIVVMLFWTNIFFVRYKSPIYFKKLFR